MIAETIYFYLPQILLGSIMGIFTAWIGIFVILRKSIFLGITLAQAITVSVILSFLFSIHNEGFIHFVAICVFLPIYWFHKKVNFKEAILAFGFVFYSALGQILTSIGANVQNHLVTAYFGNILLIPQKEWFHITIPLVIIFVVMLTFHRWFLSVSFDYTFAQISRLPVQFIEILYFLILTGILSMSIYFMGSFYSIAHLIIPGTIGLSFGRNMRISILIALIISLLSTFIGFFISLTKITILEQPIQLPTSSTIILILCFFLIIILIKKR